MQSQDSNNNKTPNPISQNDFTWAPLWFDFYENIGSKDDPKAAIAETNAYPYLKELMADLKRHEKLFLTSTVKTTAVTKGSEDTFSHPEATDNTKNVCLGNRIYHIDTNSSFCLARHETSDGGFLVIVNLDFKNTQKISIWYNQEKVSMLENYITSGAANPEIPKEELGIPPYATGRTFPVEPGGWRILKWGF